MWHPARVTKKQQQKQDQPEVGPESKTGYHQMMGGNLHVVLKKCTVVIPLGARVRFPRNSSTVVGQGRVTAALDAQDHGMVTCAFPKSISSPGMIPSPSRSPLPSSLRQETAILGVAGRRDIHVEGYGSSGEEGAQAWAIGEELEWVGKELDSAKQRIQQRYAPPYEALWVPCAPIILHCCTGSDVEPRLVL